MRGAVTHSNINIGVFHGFPAAHTRPFYLTNGGIFPLCNFAKTLLIKSYIQSNFRITLRGPREFGSGRRQRRIATAAAL